MKAQTPPPPPTSARPIEAKRVLGDLAARHRKAAQDPEQQTRAYRCRFATESIFGLREARLLALLRPDEVERWAEGAALDTAADADDRVFAVRVAGILARQGRRGAEGLLLRLAQGDATLAEEALRELSGSDPSGAHRAVYLDRARGGSVEAIKALGTFVDPAGRRLLEELFEAGREKNDLPGLRSGHAEQSLEKLDLLRAPDKVAQLEAVLREPEGKRWKLTGWALARSREAGLTTLVPTLRARLDRTFQEIGTRYLHALGAADDDGELGRRYVRDGNIGLHGGDPFYDDALVALSDLGGALTDLEKARLRHFGYQVDPAARLAELLAEPR